MQEVIQFNSNQNVIVKDENVGGFLIDIKALQVDGVTVCDIADLNKISLEVAIYRNGQKEPRYFCNDYLGYILRALSSGSTRYTIATTKRTNGYLIALGLDGSLNLNGNDQCVVKMKAQTGAFTSIDVSKSDITIETVPSVSNNPVLTIVDSVNYTAGEDSINKPLGSNIVKALLVHDLTADYLASTEAKPVNGINISANGFNKDASENLLIAENLMALQMNPETAVKDLVIYNEFKPIDNVRFKAKFDKAVGTDAKIMVLRRQVL